MPSRQRSSSAKAARQALELGAAAPVVIAHRVARMALAGPAPSARDRKEFTGMVLEKPLAFTQAWLAASQQAFKAQQALYAAAWRSLMLGGWLAPSRTAAQLARQLEHQTASVVGAALEPVRKKAVHNAKRLSRSRPAPAKRKR
ncbi:polyhydroxyalkanoate granule-associated phasin [Piscinibacter sp.]|uniref:polyhydroxyalkanoate granule-associated phasin n=1 Tax=Piscinibacter sp. TaxID=1903157 RepID=UPI0039E42F75